jgi:MFS family permease
VSATATLRPVEARSGGGAARPGLLVVGVCLGGVMVGLDGTAITIAAPSIARSTHASLADLTLIANVYLVTLAVFILPAGRLADRLGRRAGFIAGALGFAACSVGISLSTGVAELVAFRAGQGVFAALLQPTALALLSTAVPRERLSAAVGVWGAVNALAIGLGPVFAGFIVQGFGWPVVFLVNVPVAALAVILVRTTVAESRAGESSTGLRQLLAQGTLRSAAVLVAMSSFAVFGLLFVLTLYLQNVRGLTPSTAGAWLLAPTLAVVGGALAGGVMTERVGTRRPVVIGMLVVAAGLAGLSRLSVDSGYWAVALPAFLVGLGTGVWVIPATTTIVGDAGGGATGTASAIQQAASQIGGVIGVGVASVALSIRVGDRLSALLHAARVPAHAAAAMLGSQGLVTEGRTPRLGALTPHVRELARVAGHEAFAGGMRTAFLISAVLIVLGLPLGLRFRVPARRLPPAPPGAP